MGIDTSGQGDDYTVVTVFRQDAAEDYILVDMYRKRRAAINEHLYRIAGLIERYDPYDIAIEVNGGGQVFADLIKQQHPNQRVTQRVTTQASKMSDLGRLLFLVESERIYLPKREDIAQELLSFQRSGKMLAAMSGRHDDIVMSMFMAVSVFPCWREEFSSLFS